MKYFQPGRIGFSLRLAWGLAALAPTVFAGTPDLETGSGLAVRPVSIRAEASTAEGFSSALDLRAGNARLSARLEAGPGTAPGLRLGFSGPLLAAGPSRHSGLSRFLDDPCADAYLFSGSWQRPLTLDFDSRRFGAFVGRAAGIWALDADAPRLGIWAGTAREKGILAGIAAACSLLPEDTDFDSWFSEEPAVGARLLAAGIAWAGWESEDCRLLTAVACSEEDRAGRGWAGRVEWEYSAQAFRTSGRLSCASRGWKGLGGQRADPWEVRGDAGWTPLARLRLAGRGRFGIGPDGVPDWDALARLTRSGRSWTWGAELEASDASARPPVRLDPALWAGWSGDAVRVAVRASWVREGTDHTRTEVSAELALGTSKTPSLRPEGALRWTPEGSSWRAGACLEFPAPSGSWSVRFGTIDWAAGAVDVPWELVFALRSRLP